MYASTALRASKACIGEARACNSEWSGPTPWLSLTSATRSTLCTSSSAASYFSRFVRISMDTADPLWNAPNVRIESRCPNFNCTQSDFAGFIADLSAAFEPPWFTAADQAELLEAYGEFATARPGGNRSRWWWAARHLGADLIMVCPARRAASWATRRGSNSSAAFTYVFAHIPDGPSGAYPELAHHASDIPFVFRVTEAHGPNSPKYQISVREQQLAKAMATAWIELAANGTPGDNWPAWQLHGGSSTAASLAGRPWMLFDGNAGVVQADSYKLRQCNVWDRVGLPRPFLRN